MSDSETEMRMSTPTLSGQNRGSAAAVCISAAWVKMACTFVPGKGSILKMYLCRLFVESLSMGQRLHRKLPFPDQERMDQPVPYHRLQPCIQACVWIYRSVLQYSADPQPLWIPLPQRIWKTISGQDRSENEGNRLSVVMRSGAKGWDR